MHARVAFPHEILVELFRSRAALAGEVLRSIGIEILGDTVESGSQDLTQVTSAEFRADAVSIFRTSGAATAAVIVEVQRHESAAKRFTWPLYVAALRARLRCAVILLVIAPTESVAAWARQPIELGHPGFCLAPIAMSYNDIPRIEDPTVATHAPELAILSALAHHDAALARALAAAFGAVSDDIYKLYSELIKTEWPDDAKRILEKHMTPELKAKIEAYVYERGREVGGRERACAAVLSLAQSKLGELTPADVHAVESVNDDRALDSLIVELGQAITPAEVRAILDRIAR